MAISMMAATTAAGVVGGGLTAASTIAGGNRAAALGRAAQAETTFESDQARYDAGAAIAASQRRMFETQNNTNLLVSRARAAGAAGGVDIGSGSSVENQGQIEQRGHYASALDLWNGQNQATADLNKAAGLDYSGTVDVIGGKMQQDASDLTAGGQMMTTIANAGSSAYKLYGGPSAAGATPGPSDSYYTGD
jgi:hypothetical protein